MSPRFIRRRHRHLVPGMWTAALLVLAGAVATVPALLTASHVTGRYAASLRA
ncbi:hypothetical protein KQ945_12080 [Bacillus subtilis subsp. subtilis]|nr:hypothetical protein [Bacillus subtilis subsp. subtilis]